MSLEPSCPLGYTESDLIDLGLDTEDFKRWMYGQTGVICNGSWYDPRNQMLRASKCADSPHGFIADPWDVDRYLGTRR